MENETVARAAGLEMAVPTGWQARPLAAVGLVLSSPCGGVVITLTSGSNERSVTAQSVSQLLTSQHGVDTTALSNQILQVEDADDAIGMKAGVERMTAFLADAWDAGFSPFRSETRLRHGDAVAILRVIAATSGHAAIYSATIDRLTAAAGFVTPAIPASGEPKRAEVQKHVGDADTSTLMTELSEKLFPFVRTLGQAYKIPSISFGLVSRQRQVVRLCSDLDADHSLGFATPVPVASSMKPMSSLLVSKLVHDGVISWDTTLGELCSDIDNKSAFAAATVSQCLSMATGFDKSPEVFTPFRRVSREEACKSVSALQPVTSPGHGFWYLNYPWTFACIGAATRLNGIASPAHAYQRAFEDLVSKPLGLHTATFFGDTRISGYGKNEQGKVEPYTVNESHWRDTNFPALGLTVSCDDLLSYVANELSPENCRADNQVYQDRRTPQFAFNDQLGYGRGLFRKVTNGLETYFHMGLWYGVVSATWYCPSLGVGFALVANAGVWQVMDTVIDKLMAIVARDQRASDDCDKALELVLQDESLPSSPFGATQIGGSGDILLDRQLPFPDGEFVISNGVLNCDARFAQKEKDYAVQIGNTQFELRHLRDNRYVAKRPAFAGELQLTVTEGGLILRAPVDVRMPVALTLVAR